MVTLIIQRAHSLILIILNPNCSHYSDNKFNHHLSYSSFFCFVSSFFVYMCIKSQKYKWNHSFQTRQSCWYIKDVECTNVNEANKKLPCSPPTPLSFPLKWHMEFTLITVAALSLELDISFLHSDKSRSLICSWWVPPEKIFCWQISSVAQPIADC